MNAILNALKRLRLLRAMWSAGQAALRRRYGSADYARLNENMRRTFSKVISQDLYPFLKDIQAPTLLVWGSEDTETPLWMGEQMEKAIPDAGLVVFEGRTHFAFIEEWQALSDNCQAILLGRSDGMNLATPLLRWLTLLSPVCCCLFGRTRNPAFFSAGKLSVSGVFSFAQAQPDSQPAAGSVCNGDRAGPAVRV